MALRAWSYRQIRFTFQPIKHAAYKYLWAGCNRPCLHRYSESDSDRHHPGVVLYCSNVVPQVNVVSNINTSLTNQVHRMQNEAPEHRGSQVDIIMRSLSTPFKLPPTQIKLIIVLVRFAHLVISPPIWNDRIRICVHCIGSIRAYLFR